MDVYKLVKTGICGTVRYGTAAGVGVGTGLMLALRSGIEGYDGKKKKHTLQEGAIVVSASVAGYVAGDKLAKKTGALLDQMHDGWLELTGKAAKPEEKKDESIDVDYVKVD